MKFFSFAFPILVGIVFVQADVSSEIQKCLSQIRTPCILCTKDELDSYKDAAAEVKKCFGTCQKHYIFDKEQIPKCYKSKCHTENRHYKIQLDEILACYDISGNVLAFTFITTVLALLF
ncbi:hypothetical protein ABPG74_018919 [Tetrahymena malaccensis]